MMIQGYILMEVGIPMKLVTLIRIYHNGTCYKIHIGSCLSDAFPI